MKTSKLYTIILILFAIALVPRLLSEVIMYVSTILLNLKNNQPNDYILLGFAAIVIQFAAIVLLIKYAKNILAFIGIKDSNEEELSIQIDKRNVLFTGILIVGLYIAVPALAYSIVDGFELLRYNNDTLSQYPMSNPNEVYVEIIKFFLGLLLILNARKLSERLLVQVD